ncbi:MAG: recombination regulator RecX [Gammaproteobacteria bacterium]|nr:recombination regulator RecX [Gammaproteobacteria bacterium]
MKSIRNLAIRMLTRREHSKHELQQKLVAKGFSLDLVLQVLHMLEQENLLSDIRFAEMFVRTRASHGFGPVRIKAELNEYGVADEIIKSAVFAEGYDWLTLAKKARSKKFGSKIPCDLSAKLQQQRYLHYKGFDFDIIKEIIDNEE